MDVSGLTIKVERAAAIVVAGLVMLLGWYSSTLAAEADKLKDRIEENAKQITQLVVLAEVRSTEQRQLLEIAKAAAEAAAANNDRLTRIEARSE